MAQDLRAELPQVSGPSLLLLQAGVHRARVVYCIRVARTAFRCFLYPVFLGLPVALVDGGCPSQWWLRICAATQQLGVAHYPLSLIGGCS